MTKINTCKVHGVGVICSCVKDSKHFSFFNLCQQNDVNIFRAVCFSVVCFSEIHVLDLYKQKK